MISHGVMDPTAVDFPGVSVERGGQVLSYMRSVEA